MGAQSATKEGSKGGMLQVEFPSLSSLMPLFRSRKTQAIWLYLFTLFRSHLQGVTHGISCPEALNKPANQLKHALLYCRVLREVATWRHLG